MVVYTLWGMRTAPGVGCKAGKVTEDGVWSRDISVSVSFLWSLGPVKTCSKIRPEAGLPGKFSPL